MQSDEDHTTPGTTPFDTAEASHIKSDEKPRSNDVLNQEDSIMESSRMRVDASQLSSPPPENSTAAKNPKASNDLSEASLRDSRLKRLTKYRDYVSHLGILEKSVQQSDDIVSEIEM